MCSDTATTAARTHSLLFTDKFLGVVTWLAVCIAGAFAALQRLGEYGSVLQLLIGAAMGIVGALAHVVLSAFSGFRRLGFLRRGLLNWLCGYVALVGVGAALGIPRSLPSTPAYWQGFARFYLLYTGAPMLALSVLVALLTSATHHQSDA